MPLSEEELRLLEQMERALVAEDPKLASTLRGTKDRQHQRRAIAIGVAAFALGIVLLMSGAVTSTTWLGVIGFVVMLAAVFFTLTRWKSGGGAAAAGPQAPSGEAPAGLRVLDGGKKSRRKGTRGARGQQPPSGSMMDRFEERWRRRREGER